MAQPDQVTEQTGRRAEPALTPRLEFTLPSRAGPPPTAEALAARSAALQRLFAATQLLPADLERVAAWAVLPGQVVARTVLQTTEQPDLPAAPEAGPSVTRSATGEYLAERYGYLCLQDGRVAVRSPLWLTPRAMQAYWLLLDQRPHALTLELARQCLAERGVVEGIVHDALERLVAQAQRGSQVHDLFLVASGTEPVRGRDAKVELLLDSSVSAGRQAPSPRRAMSGQLVARRTPAGPGVPGRQVRGEEVPADPGHDHVLKAGENIRVARSGEIEEFYATMDGACRVVADEISVVRLLAVQGDVSLKTGNVNFAGEVYVSGSVLRNLSLRAAGSITVGGSVESDTMLVAQGDVVVGLGISGRRTRVIARRDVRADSVRDATVAASRDILLDHYAHQAYLRAGRNVVVGQGKNSGWIAGGQVWAHDGIDVYSAGSAEREPTLLAVGLPPEHAQKLARIENDLKLTSAHVQRLMEQLGLQRLDLALIRSMVDAASGANRQVLQHRTQQLSQLVRAYQHLRDRRKQLREQWAPGLAGKEVRVREVAHPGVEIRLGEHSVVLEEAVRSPRYRVQGGALVSR